MLQHTVAAVVDTRIWDGTPNQALLAWLGDDGHHFDGTQLVIHTTDGDLYPEPGWTIVRWPDRDLSVMSSRAAVKRLAPAELMGMRLMLDPSAPPGSVTLSTTRPGRMAEVDEQSSASEEVVHPTLGPQVSPPQGVDDSGSGPDFTSPLAGIEVRVPCPYCPPPAMISRTLITDHIAREHRPGLVYPPNLATNEDVHRIAQRRDSILNLLDRLDRSSTLTQEERALLRRSVHAEGMERDNLASSYLELTSYMRQISAGRETWKAKAEEIERDRDRHAAALGEVLATFVHKVDGYRLPRVRSGDVDVLTLEKWRSVVAPTGEQAAPVNWQTIAQQRERELKTAAEARRRAEMAIARVRLIRKAPSRSPFNLHANAQDDGWDQALDAVHAALGTPEQCETGNARKDHPVHELLAALEAGIPHPDPRDLISRYYQAIHELCCPYDHTEHRPDQATAANRATPDEPTER
ncbi:hypothetical protein [Streptomyces caniscabiei]|uniref:Uncharacterized protein n=1 Tax=Streptomyces caniscabiei TaxID=2746961 RepID=A0ABU4MIG3_9ACTN|nr:hypothetical protein [Streptomyces caniscabiei]MBE4790988.1 hypothetical protein [Streptomyces caniscabiei]MDX3009616.1 hypothetical protein [Streptomyces caniscabiei]MDX3037261.1 hypothetical protein [Streptomyces caniscabiei]